MFHVQIILAPVVNTYSVFSHTTKLILYSICVYITTIVSYIKRILGSSGSITHRDYIHVVQYRTRVHAVETS